MHSKLLEILEEKKREVSRLKKEGLVGPQTIPSARRDFKAAISRPGGIQLIAEIKFASPSAGVIRAAGDPAQIARQYERAGAAALSVLTDEKFFQGRLEYLPRVKEATALPVLRKDFLLEEIQIQQSRLWGADAVLLIARILTLDQLRTLLTACRQNELTALVEVHDREDLAKALAVGPEIIGINNRDLDTFTVDLKTTRQMAAEIPAGVVVVGESGIRDPEDIRNLKGMGVHAVLVGSSLMRGEDLEGQTRALVQAGR